MHEIVERLTAIRNLNHAEIAWNFATETLCQSHCVHTFCHMPQVVTKNVFSSFLLLHFGNLAGFIAKNCTEKISARQLVMCGIQAFNLRGLSPPSSTQQSKFTPKGKVMYTPGGNQRQSCKFTSSTWCAYWFTSFASFADTVYLAGLESINTFIILLGV